MPYLALLERKPGGFDHARPLEDWELPVCFGILRRRLEAELDGPGTREFIKVLRLLETHSLTALKIAVQHALEIGTTNSDAVRLILEYQQEEPVALFYECESLIVTTNLPFENWTEVLSSERLTGATLDRVTHRCHILEASGQSYRLRDAKRRKQTTGSSGTGAKSND